MQMSIHRFTSQIVTAGVFALLVNVGTSQQLIAQTGPSPDPGNDVTFTRDVAPILQANCQVCHQPGAIGPMSLMEYQDVRRYARRITRMVEARDMPPYQYDADVGIQDLKEDWRMSDDDIATISAWVAAGSPEGDPADMPEPVEWPEFTINMKCRLLHWRRSTRAPLAAPSRKDVDGRDLLGDPSRMREAERRQSHAKTHIDIFGDLTQRPEQYLRRGTMRPPFAKVMLNCPDRFEA